MLLVLADENDIEKIVDIFQKYENCIFSGILSYENTRKEFEICSYLMIKYGLKSDAIAQTYYPQFHI